MNKPELINEIVNITETNKKQAEAFLTAFTDIVTAELVKGGDVNLVGFGKFSVAEVAQREGTIQLEGARKGEKYVTPAHNAPKFKFGKNVKDLLKEQE